MALYELKGITKDFANGSIRFRALQGVDLDIEEGEVVALCGPSGSGKSTLLNILGLIEAPTSGELSFAGRSLIGVPERVMTKVRRDAVGFIFQNFNLIPVLSALENVEYALFLDSRADPCARLSRDQIRERAMKVLGLLGLEKYAHHKPAELSGGQRQRVAIARALVKNPSVVVADEPTANLDSKTASQIVDLIGHLNEAFGTTVLIATHDPAVAAACGRIVQIKDGSIQSVH